ncbi:MAG: T9SS type A sorting domain-containing protein [Chitinophagaceae bacterium]|nr:T9SS type A sorting domain-containing protein [Chitinophagaceae bacterium]
MTDNGEKSSRSTVTISVVNDMGRPDLSPVVRVFPNPVAEVASIELQGPAKGRTGINVYDINGKSVYKTEFIKDGIYVNHQINMRNLMRGLYFIEVIIDYQYRSVVKVIRN